MKQLACVFLLGSSLMMANDEIPGNLTVGDYESVIREVVVKQPSNKEIMFIDMLYQLDSNLRYDERSLKQIERYLYKTRDRRFAKIFEVDPLYKNWMLEIIADFRHYNANKSQVIMGLANDMDHAGHILGNALNSMPTYQLLYLIRYLGSSPHRILKDLGNKKVLTSSQLLIVLQEEQNSRMISRANSGQSVSSLTSTQ